MDASQRRSSTSPLERIVVFDEIIKYLIENLEISVEQITEFGPVEQIRVRLELGGNVICEDSCDLPDQET